MQFAFWWIFSCSDFCLPSVIDNAVFRLILFSILNICLRMIESNKYLLTNKKNRISNNDSESLHAKEPVPTISHHFGETTERCDKNSFRWNMHESCFSHRNIYSKLFSGRISTFFAIHKNKNYWNIFRLKHVHWKSFKFFSPNCFLVNQSIQTKVKAKKM